MPAILKCPYCGAAVDDQETFCSNCFWDLRKEADLNPPLKTQVTEKQRPHMPPPVSAPPKSPPPANSGFAPPAGGQNFDFAASGQEPPQQSPPVSPPRQAVPPRQPTPSRQPAPLPVGGPADPPRTPPKSEPPAAKPPSVPRSVPPPAASEAASSFSPSANEKDDVAQPYRPRLRPPMAVLRILDDDGQDAETVRIRGAEIVLGRTEGDVQIPHEKLMSARHAKIVRRFIDGAYRWFLIDLKSTNGTFVRVNCGRLQHGAELMIGSFRYQFDSAPQGGGSDDSEAEAAAANVPQRTMGWARVTPEDLAQALPKLLRISPGGDVTEFKLRGTDLRLGANAAAVDVAIGDDPLLSSVHVRLYQDQHRRWNIEDLGSKNGLWIAIREQELDKRSMFQLGEQRFNFRSHK